MSDIASKTELLAHAGQLLLEYNESARGIERTLRNTASSLSQQPLHVAISYNGVVVSFGERPPTIRSVPELRYNQALQARVHAILRSVRIGEIKPESAVSLLNQAPKALPGHPPWIVAALLGIAAASLARILGADAAAMITSGVSTAIGLFARKILARRHVSLLVLPFVAALIGAVCGGLAIRFRWTDTPGLALIVPSLMLVPGPHLLNGLIDLTDNYVPMSVARLTLATGILFASALGIVLGMALTLPEVPLAGQGPDPNHLNLVLDMLLAGLVTCGFAVFYNATWQQTGLAMLGGMAGHGIRFLALESGVRPEVATFFGGLVVGAVAAGIARKYKNPVAVIPFAEAVTMMPGLQMYRSLGGALQLARLKGDIDPLKAAATLGDLFQSSLVVAALALGLIVAINLVFKAGRD